MPDDNLEHMEYLLTREAYEKWLATQTVDTMVSYITDKNILDPKQFYLKEHSLPLDSEITN